MTVETPYQKDVSIVIVNYNVKEYLVNLINSINQSVGNFNVEIIVIDNNSTDGSVEYLSSKFTNVVFIANNANVGFGKANNQGIQVSRGKYILLLNPDTLIKENTLSVMISHMDNHPQTGAAGCKLLNPDGTFAPESRRSVPTPSSALWKVLGLTSIFPKSKRFSDYYLGWMDEDEPGSIPVLSGAFMFFRASVLKELGGFDERFFMYGEDIDLSYRTTQLGYQIDYVPSTSIIHYKGESTKKDHLDYVVMFNKAMYQFFDKHYSSGYSFLFKFIVKAGIIIRATSSYVVSSFRKISKPAADLVILNALVFIFFLIRYQIAPDNLLQEYQTSFLVVNGLLSGFFIALSRYYELYGINKYSVTSLIKAVLIAFAGVALVTFFLRDFAFSRWILLFGAITSTVILGVFRFYQKNYSKNRFNASGAIKPTRVLIVGISSKTLDLLSLVRSRVDWNYEIVGLIVQKGEQWVDEVENVNVIGRTEHVPDLVRHHKVEQLIFLGNSVSSDEILNIMTQIRSESLIFKIVPDSMDFIIGKSNVEYFEDVPLVDVRLSYSIPWNIFLKRNLDIFLSGFLLLTLFPLSLLSILRAVITIGKPVEVQFQRYRNEIDKLKLWQPYEQALWANRYMQLWYIFTGKISFVGAPIIENREDIPVYYKPGLTGLRQINEKRLFREKEKQAFELHYVQNYSIWLDIDVLFRTVFVSK
ncbi:MAG: glycosyltransferase [Bacteroidetes bacterium]|nr:glycosyltransferase [Bacteroidota bacterium]MCH8524293.1 glycosyltransferase [Balneolales bacterium]